MNALNLILTLTFCIMASFSQATPIAAHPQPIKSSKLNQTQKLDEVCSYSVNIETACASTFYARGEIDLSFGDAYGNRVYVRELRGPLEDCSTNRYEIEGPCTYEICHLQLYWIGDSGWKLDTVTIDNYLDDPVTFHYYIYIPQGGPYVIDYCQDY